MCARTFDENFLNLVPAEHVEGLYGCLDYYQDVKDPFSAELVNRYDALFPGSAMFTAGSACSGMYRGLKLWEAAANEAGSLDQADVIGALDHARIAQGPGGPAEMVPGQHHVRMNMYIARSEGGTFKVVKNLGHIDPKEGEVGLLPTRGRCSRTRRPGTSARTRQYGRCVAERGLRAQNDRTLARQKHAKSATGAHPDNTPIRMTSIGLAWPIQKFFGWYSHHIGRLLVR